VKTDRRTINLGLLFAAVSFTALLFTACSSYSEPNISIYLVNAPSILTANQSVSLTAGVASDSPDVGVDWTCGSAGGTFNPPHTASGGRTVFTASATTGPVTITATATADSSVKASAEITIVPVGSNAMLNGPFVFFVQGVDSNGGYCAAGTVIADGNGNITGGEQDYSDASLQSGPDAVTGTYSIGPDGRGSITLIVDDTGLPSYAVETFSIAVTSATHALIIQFDGATTSSGSLDLQAASAVDPAAIGGAFAFIDQGDEYANNVPISHGGVLVMSASSGTVDRGTYFVCGGGLTRTGSLTGSVTAPDPYGRGTITFTWGLSFAYYAVQGQALRLVGQNSPNWLVGGNMFGQGEAGANATFSNASLTGDYVLFEAGETLTGTLALAGLFSADGAGRVVSGVVDTNDGGMTTFGSIANLASYAIAGDGSGSLALPATVDSAGNVSSLVVFAVNPAINILDPNSASGGGGALVMDYESSAVATGYIVPRSSGAFEGSYALALHTSGSDDEINWVGQTVAASGGLTGNADTNDNGVTSPGLTLTGTYAADAANAGRWTGALTVGGSHRVISYYQVSSTRFVIVDLDPTNIGIGIMEMK
jgi:hypothetical protein